MTERHEYPFKTHRLEVEQLLARPLEEVFPFFSDAYNLEQITPDFLKFRVLTPRPIEMRPGTLIDYKLRVRGLPLRWQSEITVWDPPLRFVDEQRRGPYRLWHHEHLFEARAGETLVRDIVDYAVWGGALIDRLFVRRDVERIFRFRQQVLASMFS